MANEFLDPLRHTALDCAVAKFRSVLTKALDEPHVDFLIDAPASVLVVRSRDVATNGQLGKYAGEHRQPYVKADLNKVLPYAIRFPDLYPVTYRQLAQTLKTLYGIVLEQEEFAQSSDPTKALVNDDLISVRPDPTNGEIALIALASSGRWKTGSTLRLILTNPVVPIGLPSYVDKSHVPSIGLLTDAVG